MRTIVDLKIDRKNRLPIHSQLKAQLIHLIQTRQLAPGTRLPTVRQLAGFLRVNRNTVSRVFSEMEREGYVICMAGRGTHVAPAKSESKIKMQKVQGLIEIIDEAIQRARQLGFGADELSLTLYARTQISQPDPLGELRTLFIECNKSDTDLFRKQLEQELNIQVDALLVDELQQAVARDPDYLKRYALLITTFYHIREVQAMIAKTAIDVVGLMPDTSIETLMRLTALPEGTTVGVACHDGTGAQNVRLSIERAGLTHLNVVEGSFDRPDSVQKMLKGASVVICTSLVEEKIRAIPELKDKDLIVECRRLEPAGVEMLRSRLRQIAAGIRESQNV
jgi:GntR family transcriptional regulator